MEQYSNLNSVMKTGYNFRNRWSSSNLINRVRRNSYLLIIILSVACGHTEKNADSPVTVKIDIGTRHNEKSIADFQSRFSINRLIPIETSDVSLLGGNLMQVIVSGEDVFILDGTQQFTVFRYNIAGKFIRSINRRGNGPQEYINAISIAVANDKLYVADNMGKRILQYDLDGKYLNTVSLDHNVYQLIVDRSGNMIMTGSYTNNYMLYIYDQSGTNIANYFPRDEKLGNMMLTQTSMNSLKFYKNGIYVTNYFDPTIYYIRDNEVKPLAVFDFGINNIPQDLFIGDPRQKMEKFTANREKSVMSIDNLTITDDWIIFVPEKFRDFYVVYYNRKQNNYMTNRDFNIPYSTFFGNYKAPYGYTEAGEYYSLIDSWDLRNMIEELAEKDNDYLSKYEFLKGIDPTKIQEEDNPWIVFYTLK